MRLAKAKSIITTACLSFINFPRDEFCSTAEQVCSALRDEIENKLRNQNQYNLVSQTSAYIAFDKALIEFVKNSKDAGASSVSVEIFLEPEDLEILFLDINENPIPTEKAGPYNWKQALTTRSEKDFKTVKSGGQHLGLAMPAFFLKMNGGELSLRQYSENSIQGTCVILFSSTTSCSSIMEDVTPKMMLEHLTLEELNLVREETLSPVLQDSVRSELQTRGGSDDFSNASRSPETPSVGTPKISHCTFFKSDSNNALPTTLALPQPSNKKPRPSPLALSST